MQNRLPQLISKLDEIADSVQGQNSRLALEIDRVSDHLEGREASLGDVVRMIADKFPKFRNKMDEISRKGPKGYREEFQKFMESIPKQEAQKLMMLVPGKGMVPTEDVFDN